MHRPSRDRVLGELDARTSRLLRDAIPGVVAALTRRYSDLSAAEDAVQEALIVAATKWPRDGVPDEPRAWLLRVAHRRMTDHVRAEIARRKREAIVVGLVGAEDQLAIEADPGAGSEADDVLVLLFTCCHPALSTASAIALTLRAVAGLTTAEIARAFLVPEATMAQRIVRAKRTIEDSKIPFELPSRAETVDRLATVMHVLYLLFNEGYTASAGTSVHRIDLSEEAIRLTRLLHRLAPDEPEVLGLLALMLLTDARRDARTGPAGELISLEDQDRSRWDRAAIAEGIALTTQALSRGAIGAYQLQAAIAAIHDEAERVESTDWPQILALYGLLMRIEDNPMVSLSHAIATAMVDGPDVGLARLDELARDPRLTDHHRLEAARAHLHERAGRTELAAAAYRRAAERTASLAERDYLLLRAARVGNREVSK